MLVPDVKGSYVLIFRKRCLPMHVAVARQHEDRIHIFQPKSLGQPAIDRNRVRHCAIVPRGRVALPPTLHPHRKIAQTAQRRWVKDRIAQRVSPNCRAGHMRDMLGLGLPTTFQQGREVPN